MSDRERKSDDVKVYSNGVVHCSVCVRADLTHAEIIETVNRIHPSGTTHGWNISEEPTFRQGGPNPCICEQHADRMHYLMVC